VPEDPLILLFGLWETNQACFRADTLWMSSRGAAAIVLCSGWVSSRTHTLHHSIASFRLLAQDMACPAQRKAGYPVEDGFAICNSSIRTTAHVAPVEALCSVPTPAALRTPHNEKSTLTLKTNQPRTPTPNQSIKNEAHPPRPRLSHRRRISPTYRRVYSSQSNPHPLATP
jgi:hypothetical protein